MLKKITIKFTLSQAMVLNFLMSILGISFFFITNSSSILFDGIFSFAMFISGLVTFLIKFKINKNDELYPFGVSTFENIFSVIKTLILIILSIYFIYDSSQSIYYAVTDPLGLPTAPIFWVYIIYVGILSLVCIYNYITHKICLKNYPDSMIIKTEAKSALLDFFITCSIGIALTVSALLFVEGSVQGNQVRTIVDKSVLLTLIVLASPGYIPLIKKNIHILTGKRMNITKEQELAVLIDEINFNKIHYFSYSDDDQVIIEIDYKEAHKLNKLTRDKIHQKIKLFNQKETSLFFTIKQ